MTTDNPPTVLERKHTMRAGLQAGGAPLTSDQPLRSTQELYTFRPFPDSEKYELGLTLAHLLTSNIIRGSGETTGCPCRGVRLAQGVPELVIDYSQLNQYRVRVDNNPPPDLESLLVQVGSRRGKYIAVFDLRCGLHPLYQYPMVENDKHLTAFTTPFGVYEWNRVPNGLGAHADWFDRVAMEALDGIPVSTAVTLWGSLVVWGETVEQLAANIDSVLLRVSEYDIMITPPRKRIGVPVPWTDDTATVADALLRILERSRAAGSF